MSLMIDCLKFCDLSFIYETLVKLNTKAVLDLFGVFISKDCSLKRIGQACDWSSQNHAKASPHTPLQAPF